MHRWMVLDFKRTSSQGDLTGPEAIWTILDRFHQLGLDMQITEFDFGTTDEQLASRFHPRFSDGRFRS